MLLQYESTVSYLYPFCKTLTRRNLVSQQHLFGGLCVFGGKKVNILHLESAFQAFFNSVHLGFWLQKSPKKVSFVVGELGIKCRSALERLGNSLLFRWTQSRSLCSHHKANVPLVSSCQWSSRTLPLVGFENKSFGQTYTGGYSNVTFWEIPLDWNLGFLCRTLTGVVWHQKTCPPVLNGVFRLTY